MIEQYYSICDLNLFCKHYTLYITLGCKKVPLSGGPHFVEARGPGPPGPPP